MLVLTRKVGEQIVIGSDIRVQVLAIHGRHIKIGIEAPDTVPVFRSEVLAAKSTVSANPVDPKVRTELGSAVKKSQHCHGDSRSVAQR